jgi:hypothetical protein
MKCTSDVEHLKDINTLVIHFYIDTCQNDNILVALG